MSHKFVLELPGSWHETRNKIVYCTIDGVYIELAQIKDCNRYRDYTGFAHKKRTLICPSEYPWLTYREYSPDFHWLGARTVCSLCHRHSLSPSSLLQIPPSHTPQGLKMLDVGSPRLPWTCDPIMANGTQRVEFWEAPYWWAPSLDIFILVLEQVKILL